MTTQDRLWKMIIEVYFREFLEFYFPDDYHLFDLEKGFEFLDKELKELYPNSNEKNRHCDLLVKVWLKDGSEYWILIHIEVQGYKDEEFPRRMYEYNYRGEARFGAFVASLGILTDNDKDWMPNCYEHRALGSRRLYEFPIYKLARQQVADLEASDNMFAIVMQAAMIGMKKRWKGEALMEVKLALFRKMLTKGFSQMQIRGLLDFIKYYVRFSDKELLRKFEAEIDIITNTKNESNMSVLDTALELALELAIETDDKEALRKEVLMQRYFEVAIAEEKAMEKGMEKGREEGMEKGREEGMTKGEIAKATKVIKKIAVKYPAWPDKEIADITEMPVSFVKKVREELKPPNAEPVAKARKLSVRKPKVAK